MSNTTAVKPAAAPAMFKLLEGVSAIEKALASIKTRGATLQRDVHIAACSVLAHVGKHKDIQLVTKLLESMPDMSRKNAIKAWFESFGPVAWKEDGAIMFQPATPLKLGDAMGKPFWSFKPEQAYVPLEVGKAFASFIKRLEKDAKETGRDHAKLIAQLTNLAPEDESESKERTANNAAVAKQVESAKAPRAPRAPKAAPVAAPVASEPVAVAA